MTDVADFFDELGRSIRSAWEATAYDHGAFAAIASAALAARPPASFVDAGGVLEWPLGARALPEQRDLQGRFGEPPITVYNAGCFHIDVLFWLDGTTLIHDHRFSGAFHVLAGSSLHTRYTFQGERDWGDALRTGALTPVETELLATGTTRSIEAGPGLLHALFHLERPSASVVVRTPFDPRIDAQHEYIEGVAASSGFAPRPELARALQVLGLQWELQDPRFLARAIALLAPDGPRPLSAMETTFALDRLFRIVKKASTFAPLLDVAAHHHPELVPVLRGAFRERRRQLNLTHRRRQLRKPSERLLLAILLNAHSRERALDLVRVLAPGQDPVRYLLDGLRDCEPLAVDEASLALLAPLLRGTDLTEALREIAAERAVENMDDLRDLGRALATSDLFGAILR